MAASGDTRSKLRMAIDSAKQWRELAESLKSRVDELNQEMDALLGAEAGRAESLKSQSDAVAALTHQVEDMRAEVVEARAEEQAVQQELKDSQDKCARMETLLTQARAESDAADDDIAQRIKIEDGLREQLRAALAAEAAAAASVDEKAAAETAAANARADAALREVQEVREQLAAAEGAAQQQDGNELQDKVDAAIAAQRDAEQRLKDSELRVASAEADAMAAECAADRRVEEAEAAVEEMKVEIAAMSARVLAMEDDMQRLSAAGEGSDGVSTPSTAPAAEVDADGGDGEEDMDVVPPPPPSGGATGGGAVGDGEQGSHAEVVPPPPTEPSTGAAAGAGDGTAPTLTVEQAKDATAHLKRAVKKEVLHALLGVCTAQSELPAVTLVDAAVVHATAKKAVPRGEEVRGAVSTDVKAVRTFTKAALLNALLAVLMDARDGDAAVQVVVGGAA